MSSITRTNNPIPNSLPPLKSALNSGAPSSGPQKRVRFADHEVQQVEPSSNVRKLYEGQKVLITKKYQRYSDENAIKYAIEESKKEFLKSYKSSQSTPSSQGANEALKAKQLEIDLLHQNLLSNTNSHACWVNTALETLKYSLPHSPFAGAVANKTPKLTKFSQGLNVNSNDLRKEVRGLIDGDSKNKISEDGIVQADADPNDILGGLCQKLGLESEAKKFFFNTEAIQADTSPQALMQSNILNGSPPPEHDQFIMTINRELNEDHTMKRCSCEDLFTPFKIFDSPENPSYQPLAITCNVGAHFVSFQKIGTNWHLRDDLNLLQNRLNQDETLQPKPSLKQALDLHSQCHLDQEKNNKTWMQYIQETAINVLFEKVQ
ncbi:MAG: hypothetical protein DVB29_07525 [Verrucomicrobia bacterium]|nr:MAG: hypothetical protein DVB29_07525 [Verrucomicrobiota bacterium]